MSKDIKKSVDYKILIKAKDVYYKIGTIVIKAHTGDILYTPSFRYIYDPNAQEKKEIDHVSWHANGQVHIKHRDDTVEKYDIIQKNGERQKISEIGFQELLRDMIVDYQQLPEYHKKVIKLDVVFDVADYHGPVGFHFSIVSGRLIAAGYEGRNVPITAVNYRESNSIIASNRRALGYHSGNADLMLQYSLRNEVGDNQRTQRQLYIAHDMKISK
jgi:hypothetical protein